MIQIDPMGGLILVLILSLLGFWTGYLAGRAAEYDRTRALVEKFKGMMWVLKRFETDVKLADDAEMELYDYINKR